MQNSFLYKIVSTLLEEEKNLENFSIILPGKRPVVFIKKILKEKGYVGILPEFLTIEDLISELSEKTLIKGIPLWLFSFETYQSLFPSEDFSSFLKWFPTLLKDWDDMLKFSDDKAILEYMFDDERIKNWGENLGNQDNARNRNLNFWRKMNDFLPILRKKLEEKNWATQGMIHQEAKKRIGVFSKEAKTNYIFCGFNALTPIEEKLLRSLLQAGKARSFFQADEYYMNDKKQEAGVFLRKMKTWKEFGENRPFEWIENQFSQHKNIKVYDVAGNISQTKILPNIFDELSSEENYLDKTAVVLLDENLLPASLDVLSSVEKVNITMGFPIKNLGFSTGIKALFHLQKNLEKKSTSYYYADLFPILETFFASPKEQEIIQNFRDQVEDRNLVYISEKLLKESLGELSLFALLEKPESTNNYLDLLTQYCYELKFNDISDIEYENISLFEKSFRVLKNQLQPYSFHINMENLSVLINQLINSETIDFQGEPLDGLQIMGLLETRLLNFENIVLLSVNEGKLPLGNTQNTYLPFDVRKNFELNTFLENDSIYAYHFYRLLQDSKNIFMLYNSNTSGTNTGEKSRFINQIEMESSHTINHIVIENASEPMLKEAISISKTAVVMEKLQEWKTRVSASHLLSYLYNPLDFYFNIVLKAKETEEIEEELSVRDYGNLVHYALQFLYEKIKGKLLTTKDLDDLLTQTDEAIEFAILEKLNHSLEYYKQGMNYIHKSIATKSVEQIIQQDYNLIKAGNTLQILDLEKKLSATFYLDETRKDAVQFFGFADRIDRVNGILRIIDYKSATAKKLDIKPKEEDTEDLLFGDDYKQALQLSIYAYCILQSKDYPDQEIQTGIWSFTEIGKGLQSLSIYGNTMLDTNSIEAPMQSIKKIIEEILNPAISFTEKE